MLHFDYLNGVLHAEAVGVPAIADVVETPFYCYSTATLQRHYKAFASAVGPDARVFYAMKANSNLAVLKTLAKLGAGADTVSEGEVRRALAAGIPASKIVFSGVGKSDRELAFAVDTAIYQVNIETEDELHALSRIAAAKGKRQPAVIRINPDVGAGGHAKITTGSTENKFGVSITEAARLYDNAANMPGVRVLGLAVHIGSQIRDLAELEAAFTRMGELVDTLRGHGHSVERLDLGGGLGIPYEMEEAVGHGPDLIEAYAAMARRILGRHGVELGFEPGRLIVGNAGILVTEVIYVKDIEDKSFVIVDAAMNDLIRPTLYEAWHEIQPVVATSGNEPRIKADVVGPVCETGDYLALDREMARPEPGDLLAVSSAGAYGAVQAGTYNSRLLVPEVLVKDNQFHVIRPRRTYDELIGLDSMPAWLD